MVANINSPIHKSTNMSNLENEKILLTTLREMLQGMERAQDPPEILTDKNKKKPYYDIYTIEQIEQMNDLKLCKLSMKNAHVGTATIINCDAKANKEISLMSRKSCGYNAFEDDTVYVEINDKDLFTGKVVGVQHSYHKPINSIYVCKVCRDQGSLMTPLDKSFPKIHVDNEPGRRKYESEQKTKGVKVFRDEQKSQEIKKREQSKYADNLYVSIFDIKLTKANSSISFLKARVEQFDPETCDKLFLVFYEYWNTSLMYPSGKVVGMISTYDSFKDSLHLILPLCKVEPPIINETYKKEISSIQSKVKDIRDLPSNIVPQGAMVFTIDNTETRDMDDAISYHIEGDITVIGVHIADITKYISPQHEIYRQAQRRFSTAYTPKELGEKPIYLIDKSLSTYFFSLVPHQPRAVLSVMFHFPTNGSHIPSKVEFFETIIRSKYKLNYAQVEEWIKAITKPDDVEEDLFISIKGVYEIAKLIRRNRLPHSFFVRQSNYNRPGFNYNDSFNAQFLIEEFMIMANEHVARKIYASYPNMTLIRVQNPVVEFQEWEDRLFERSNTGIPSSLTQYRNLLNIKRCNENHKDLVVSLQYYNDLKRYAEEDPELAKNMIRYDEYINDFYVHICEWYQLSHPARYECSIENSVDNRHFSLDKDVYTHFTSPIRRFSDVIAHRLLKSIIHNEIGNVSVDQETIHEVCSIANKRSKSNKLFEKYCAPYAVFEGPHPVFNFVLDCTCSNITNEELHFVHPSLERSISIKPIKFSNLSLDAPPVQLNNKESATSCFLRWKKIIFLKELSNNNSPHSLFYINGAYSARLSQPGHKLLRELRRSFLSAEQLESKLKELSKAFCVNECSDVISSDSSVNPIIEIHQKLFIKDIIRIQFCSYKVNGLKRITPELLIVHPSFQLCLIHQEDPVMCFVPGGKLKLEHNDIIWKFESIVQYKKYFIPLIQLESLKEILNEKSEFTLLDVPIEWINVNSSMTRKREKFGIIIYDAEMCQSKNIKFSEESDEVEECYADIINDGLESVTGDLVCLRGKKKQWENYWVGHGAVVNVSKYKENELTPLEKHIIFMLTQSDFDIFAEDLHDMKFTVEVYLQSVSSKRQLLAVSSIHKDKFLRSAILGKEIISPHNDREMIDFILKELKKEDVPILNQNQMKALTNAIDNKLSLIWGPPGTGKTSIGCILAYCYCIKNKRLENDGVVLYCGPSNECVNLVAYEMKKKFPNKCPRLLRIFGEQQELADFPLPGFFSSNKPLYVEMREISLHFLIREMDHQIAQELREYDAKFKDIIGFPSLFQVEDNDGKSIYEIILEYKELVKKAKIKLIENNEYNMVLCTTSVSAAKIMDQFEITQVIIDEAGMCKEPETLVPIINSSRSVKNVVLIGDHKQLRPIILDDLARKRGLQISLFERFQFLSPKQVTMLNLQYRMHPSICEFPSQFFYSGKLRTIVSHKWSGLQKSNFFNPKAYSKWNGVDYTNAKKDYKIQLKVSGYSAIPDREWPGQRRRPFLSFSPRFHCYPERLLFVHIVGDEIVQSVATTTCSENSRANIAEIEAVGYLYDKLISRFADQPRHAPKNILVLTQYRLQEDLLFKECKLRLTNRRITTDPIVKTVIKSQGSENDYVIFSTVRSIRNTEDIIKAPSPGWESKYLGFITDENQVNVALTRARKGLIIIGNKNLLSVNKMWKNVLNDLEKRGCVIDDFKKFI